VVSYDGVDLATLIGPTEFIIDPSGTAYLTTTDPYSGAFFGVTIGPYDAVSNYSGFSSALARPEDFNTSVGLLHFTDIREAETFQAKLSDASPVPEPTSIVFLGTGVLGLLGLLRHRASTI
jgi:hypothetical protein